MAGRDLSYRQVNRCETARESACKCRCGGTLHGRSRVDTVPVDRPREWFEALPVDDPHRLTSESERKNRAARARRRASHAAWAAKWGESALFFVERGDPDWAGIKARLAAHEGLRALALDEPESAPEGI